LTISGSEAGLPERQMPPVQLRLFAPLQSDRQHKGHDENREMHRPNMVDQILHTLDYISELGQGLSSTASLALGAGGMTQHPDIGPGPSG
jgi:hypothetical protein